MTANDYYVAISDNPRIPVGTRTTLPTNTRIWIGATVKPDGHMGDLTAIRADLVCIWCRPGDIRMDGHDDCPNRPAPEPWCPHEDQPDMLEGLL